MDAVLLDKTEGVGTITLNRPEERNAFSDELVAGVRSALEVCRDDPAVRCILLTGAGKAFSAGGNLSELAKGFDNVWRGKSFLWDRLHPIPLLIETLDKPIIAGLNGHAVGAGLDLALMCDMRIASSAAKFSAAYVRLGVAPGAGGAFFLTRIVGEARALELLLTGDAVDAHEALRIGLVTRVVDDPELPAAARELASRLAQGAPLAQMVIKRAVRQVASSDLRHHLDYISSQMALLFQSDDFREGVAAAREKRAPSFRGQ